MLIALLTALAAGGPETPVQQPPPPSPRFSARDLVRMQFDARAKPIPPQTGAEATVVGNAYLKSIGRPIQPATDPSSQADGSTGANGAK